MHLDEFRISYPAFLPKRTPGDPDECVQMTTEDGLRLLVGPTDEPVKIDQAPDNSDDAAIGRYLWVIGTTACPHGLERGSFGQARRLGQMKHTNLTGGSEAHCGGELWFLSDDRVLLNGDSGRYGPSSEKQLHDAACCLQALGYRAGYLRFNEGNKPRSIATGEEDIVWL